MARKRDVQQVEAARKQRRVATRSEELLWEQLRARRFEGLKFRRQHPLGSFVLDFYCERLRFAVSRYVARAR